MNALHTEDALTDLNAMAWLDARKIANAFTRITREPARLVGWICWCSFFFWKLVLQPHGIGKTSLNSALTPMDVAASMLLFVASLSLIRGEHPAMPFFASQLEARWMTGSHLRPWITIPYIQMRNVLQRPPSFALFIAFVLAYCMPSTLAPVGVAFAVANVSLMTLCSRIFALPRELAPPTMRGLLIAAGIAMGLFSIISGLEAASTLFLHLQVFPPSVPILHPGVVFLQGARGDVHVLLAASALFSACLFSLVLLSRDRYPELFEISRAGWEVRSRFREGRLYQSDAENRSDLSAQALARIPAGAAVLLWANLQMYRRQSMRHWPVVRPLLVLAIGVVFGSLHIDLRTVGTVIAVMFGLATSYSSLLDSTRVGLTIRHPIFWLTNTSFISRLTMVLFGWYWRSALDLVLFAIGAICGGIPPLPALTAALCASMGVWLQRCIGLAAFAILPSKVDLNGPTALAILALTVLIAVPPIVIGVVTEMACHTPVPGYIVGGVAALLEAFGLISLASRLLDGRFDKILGG